MANEERKLYGPDGSEITAEVKLSTREQVLVVVALVIVIATLFGFYLCGRYDGKHVAAASCTSSTSSAPIVSSGWSVNGVSIGTVTVSKEEIDRQRQLIKEQEARQEAERQEKERVWNHRPRLSPPLDAPPSTVKVGPYTYHVHYTTADALSSQGALGLTNIEKREIWLNPERDLRVDLTHELLHCAKDLGTSSGYLSGWGSEEEQVVHAVSPMLVGILRDNPELTAWLVR